jgi:Contact-dependent growth inhibition CdiA C-terminal domain
MAQAFSMWLSPAFNAALELRPDLDQVEALAPEREALWTRLQAASFLTNDEKRAAAGYGEKGAALARTAKFNPNPDDAGRFTTSDGVGGGASRDRQRQFVQAGFKLPIKPIADLLVSGVAKFKEYVRRYFTKATAKVEKLPDHLKPRSGAGNIIGDTKLLKPHELRWAEKLKGQGHRVELVPRGLGKTPDFRINGALTELKEVSNVVAKTPNGISLAASRIIYRARKQASHLLIDAEKQIGMTEGVALQTIERTFGKDTRRIIKSITIYTKSGPVHRSRR